MIWLAFFWLGLIVLWGASEAWDLASLRQHAADAVHHLHLHRRSHPFDWARAGGGRTGVRGHRR